LLLTHYWWGWVFLLNVPVSLIGLLAAFALLPESRAAERPRLDLTGVFSSTAGLAAVTYGLIRAGQNGWNDAGAVLLMIAGLLALVGFLFWERRLSRRPDGQPLVDPALFRSAPFTWGVIVAAILVLAMIGVLFTTPQYFQGVLGTDAMGSGLKLLPLIGGLILGALPADRVARRVGAKITIACGFAVLAAGLLLGADTSMESSGGFVAAWMALVGAGMGLGLATAASIALSELPPERSGVGSAVMQALQKIGGPLGSATLGSVLSSAYQGRLKTSGLLPTDVNVMKQSVFGGLEVARRLHSASLLHSVRAAFVHGMDVSLVVSTGIAVAGMVLAVIFVPDRVTMSGGTATDGADVEPASEAEQIIVGSHG
jgi:DHA2 family multidrug resistance protein-like MFS transporter